MYAWLRQREEVTKRTGDTSRLPFRSTQEPISSRQQPSSVPLLPIRYAIDLLNQISLSRGRKVRVVPPPTDFDQYVKELSITFYFNNTSLGHYQKLGRYKNIPCDANDKVKDSDVFEVQQYIHSFEYANVSRAWMQQRDALEQSLYTIATGSKGDNIERFEKDDVIAYVVHRKGVKYLLLLVRLEAAQVKAIFFNEQPAWLGGDIDPRWARLAYEKSKRPRLENRSVWSPSFFHYDMRYPFFDVFFSCAIVDAEVQEMNSDIIQWANDVSQSELGLPHARILPSSEDCD